MNCPFDDDKLTYEGTPVEQARCLLRFVGPGGEVGPKLNSLPSVLEHLLGTEMTLGRDALLQYLASHQINQSDVGGSIDHGVTCAGSNTKKDHPARYFVIHDTSDKIDGATSFPANINSNPGGINNVQSRAKTIHAHMVISRLGESATAHDYSKISQPGTKFDSPANSGEKGAARLGLFLHHEMVQPRIAPPGHPNSDRIAPVPGFTVPQYSRLALLYVIASFRAKFWLIPAFHCVIDQPFGNDAHDDPQHFDLDQFANFLTAALAEMHGSPAPAVVSVSSPVDTNSAEPANSSEGAEGENAVASDVDNGQPYTLKSNLLEADSVLREIASGDLVLSQPLTNRRVDGIETIQRALNHLAQAAGVAVPIDLGPDEKSLGFFGPQTLQAVKDFQHRAGLTEDGVVGDDTLRALDVALVAIEGSGPIPSMPQVALTPPAPKPENLIAPAAAKFDKTLAKVYNRGRPSVKFLKEMVAWAKTAPDDLFTEQPGNTLDIYNKIVPELPLTSELPNRKACMLEVMRVLAGFESSWDWNDGVDTSRNSRDTPTNSEAGAWQVSADSLTYADLRALVKNAVGSFDGIEFQRAMKGNHLLAMEYIARLIRHTWKANGPLYKGAERLVMRKKFQPEEESIYPHLSREAVNEFKALLTT